MPANVPVRATPPLPGLLDSAPAALREEFREAAVVVRLTAGRTLLRPGAVCESILFPVDTAFRVFQTGPEGREVTLYRIDPAESCVLSASCAIGEAPFPALATVERTGRAWAIPAAVFRGWVGRHPFWRRYVFALVARRLGQVLAKMEDVTFRRVDARVAGCLLARAEQGQVRATHQALADEIGTAREVVSRTLAQWESAGWVRTARGRIGIEDAAALRHVAGQRAGTISRGA